MPKPFSDKKWNLGEPLASQLKDFCRANYKCPALEVIRVALKEHLERRLSDPEMKDRYEAARKDRMGLPAKVVKLADKP
jgi:hypothetical protein